MDEKVKQKLLLLLDKFVAVCEQQGLQYYLAGGSVLGAVRHKGLIPWDDDIDVVMHRADYERLQELPDSVWEEGFRLATWKKTKNYPYDFLKLELTNTTIIERLYPDYIGGVFLDVFPIDRISNDPEEIAPFEQKLKTLEDKYIECTISNNCECRYLSELIKLKFKRCFYNHKKTMSQFEGLVTSFDKNSDNICHSHIYFLYKGGVPAEWFGDGTTLEYEGRQVIVPKEYDLYLKHIYGDYMKLPPVESRGGHNFMFADYDKRLNPMELKQVLRDLHKQYGFKFSLKREIKRLLRR